jgi:tRNA G18 (ribose-2'-O)-methylase SpoU
MRMSHHLLAYSENEQDGRSEMIKDAATLYVQIPTGSKVESLNVSRAAGIILNNRFWFNRPQIRK